MTGQQWCNNTACGSRPPHHALDHSIAQTEAVMRAEDVAMVMDVPWCGICRTVPLTDPHTHVNPHIPADYAQRLETNTGYIDPATPVSEAPDWFKEAVDHPSHYTSSPAKCSGCGKGIECIDIVQHMNFPVGSVVKYLWRMDGKGAPIEDLRKAIKYIEFEIARREAQA